MPSADRSAADAGLAGLSDGKMSIRNMMIAKGMSLSNSVLDVFETVWVNHSHQILLLNSIALQAKLV